MARLGVNQVRGTKGNIVTYEVLGVEALIRRIRKDQKLIATAADAGVLRAAAFIEEEVKESIAGKRAETKSVDTGRLINSIRTDKIEKGVVQVKTNVPYAKHLEFGTSKIPARRHFRNTVERNKAKVAKEINSKIKIALS